MQLRFTKYHLWSFAKVYSVVRLYTARWTAREPYQVFKNVQKLKKTPAVDSRSAGGARGGARGPIRFDSMANRP